MKKSILILILVFVPSLLFSENSHDISDKFNELIANNDYRCIKKLIGVESSDGFLDFLVETGGFVANHLDKKFYGYLKGYNDLYVIVMSSPAKGKAEQLVDIEIIPRYSDEYLSKHTGFIGDKNVDNLIIITDRYPPVNQEIIDSYRLVFYFDCENESIVNVTYEDIIVYND